MNAHRNNVITDLEKVPQVSLEYYEKHVLPHTVYRNHIEDIIQTLKDSNALMYFDGQDSLRWADFPIDPKHSGNKENDTFKCMTTISVAVVEAAQKVLPDGPRLTTVMECKPHKAADSEGPNGSFVSDGHYRILQSRRPKYVENATSDKPGEKPHNADTINLACDRPALEEYKLNDRTSDRNDNVFKLVGNTSQVMYADPTRRFMFGSTIENTSTHLWFFSRAIVLTTEPFNFIEEYTHLIHYILSLSFAAEEELGYDLSMTRIAYRSDEDPNVYNIQYDYRVGENTYRTIKSLSSFRASGLLSRATRVWKVRLLNDPKYREHALKDVWVPSDAKTELEIQLEIFHNIEENRPDIGREYRKHFMDILECKVVQTSRMRDDDMKEFVRLPLTKNKEFILGLKIPVMGGRILSGSVVSVPAGGSLANSKDSSLVKEHLYKGRKHVRVVFAEAGTPLSHVKCHHILFTALMNALKGLQYMFIGHYVHRDISAGNILLCNGTARISDLEYAKKFMATSGPRNDPKTGTPVYMAIEVQETDYFFLQIPTQNPWAFRPPVVLHNYLHDVESLFWVGLHALFSTIPVTCTKAQHAEYKSQCDLFNSIFPHHLEGGLDRRKLITHGNFQNAEDILPPEYWPALKRFKFLRDVLIYKYTDAYQKPNFPQHDNFNSVYATDAPAFNDPDPNHPDFNLFAAFKAVADAAWDGETRPLPDESNGVAFAQPALVFREQNNNTDGDWSDDQSYVNDSSGYSDSEDDEGPPTKRRRT